MIKGTKSLFDKWVAYVEFCNSREGEFNHAKKMVITRRKFKKKLKDEYDKQLSKLLLNGIKALNQNNLKNEDEGKEEEEYEDAEAANTTVVEAKEETKEAFQNFEAVPTKTELQKSLIFG